jgi:hypothetical protein
MVMIADRLQRPFLTLVALFAVLCFSVLPAWSADPEARALLEGIYANYIGEGSQGLWFESEEAAATVFTPELAALYGADIKEVEETGEIGRLDFDPFINGQDWVVDSVDVEVQETGPETAIGEARFSNFDADSVVRYDLVKTADGWRIDDIRWDNIEFTLREILQPSMD